MQGFVNVDGSRYVQTLDLLDRVITTTFSNSTVKYYSFGISSDELIGEQSSQKAQKPIFYGKKPQLQNAKLSAVIKPKNQDKKDELLILITDLYQKKSSQESPIIKTIKEHYIQKGKAVGIVPVQSEFKGTIYDVGKQNVNFKWQTDNDAKKFTPFYVIFLGKYEDIVRYFNNLKGKLSFITNDKFVIFYSRFLEKPLFLKKNQKVLPKEISQRKNINKYGIRVQLKDSSSTDITDILEIPKKFNNQIKIKYKVDYHSLPYTLPVELKGEPTTNANISELIKMDSKLIKMDSKLINFSSQWDWQNNELSFITKLNPIQKAGVYKYALNILPKKFMTPLWWNDWNFNEEDAKAWIAEPDKFEGFRTYNLLPFLQSLSEVTFQEIESNKSPIGRFCYIIQK